MGRKVISILSIILALSIVANLTVYGALALDERENNPIEAQPTEWVTREDIPKTITFTPNTKNQDNINKEAAEPTSPGNGSENTSEENTASSPISSENKSQNANNKSNSSDAEVTPSATDDKSKTLTYETSRNVAPDDTIDIYKDENNDEYRFSDGRMTGYYNNETTPWTKKNADPITEEEAIAIAKKHIEETYGIDLSPYELEVSYNNERYDISYIIYYGKGNFISGPKITVRVHEKGEIIYSNNNARLYKGYDFSVFKDVTKDELCAYVEKQLRATLNEHLISFEIQYAVIVEKDDRPILSLLVAVKRTFEGDPDPWPVGMEIFYEITQ